MTPCPHLLDVDDLSPADFDRVLDLRRPRPSSSRVLAGHGVALVFEKPSARTRNTTEMAVVALGGHPVYIQGTEVGLERPGVGRGRGPHPGLLPPVLCARVIDHARLAPHGRRPRQPAASTCRSSTCSPTGPTPARPSPTCSPCARRSGPLPGRSLAYIGDANNVWRSLALAALDGRHGRPGGLARRLRSRPRNWPASMRARSDRAADRAVTDDPEEAAAGADALYTDVWTSMGQEEERATRLARLRRLHRSTRPWSAGPRPTPWCSTACRPTGARRSAPRWSTGPGAWSGSRPPTGCTPCGACWPGPSSPGRSSGRGS